MVSAADTFDMRCENENMYDVRHSNWWINNDNANVIFSLHTEPNVRIWNSSFADEIPSSV